MRSITQYSQTALLVAGAIWNVTLFAAQQAGPTLTTIYTFAGQPDAASPNGNLIVDKTGALYGPSTAGGASGAGAVFQVKLNGSTWTESVLYSFTGGADGGSPYGSLVMDASGTLYGTTQVGGNGCGVVFQLVPGTPWTENVLYTFGCGADGNAPNGSLVFDQSGALYGTTVAGGIVNAACPGDGGDVAAGCGVVFKLTPGTPWTESVLYSFTGALDGAAPGSGLTFDASGNLNGTAYSGGPVSTVCLSYTIGQAPGCGVVFQLTPPGSGSTWTENTLYAFTGASDGSNPQTGLARDSKGNLYGTTGFHGGTTDSGTVFEVSPPATSGNPWNFAVLKNLGAAHGAHPYGNLVVRGTGHLYGATYLGGKRGAGAIFELSPPAKAGGIWTEVVMHSFTGKTDGGNPFGGLVANGTALFGTTSLNGGPSDSGTVFELKP